MLLAPAGHTIRATVQKVAQWYRRTFEREFWKRVRRLAWGNAREKHKIPVGVELTFLALVSSGLALAKYSSGGWEAVVSELWSYAAPVGIWGALYAAAFLYYANRAPAEIERSALAEASEAREQLARLAGGSAITVRVENLKFGMSTMPPPAVGGFIQARMFVAFENQSTLNGVIRAFDLLVVDTATGATVWRAQPRSGRLAASSRLPSGAIDFWNPRNANIPGRHCLSASISLNSPINADLASALTQGQHEIAIELDAMGQVRQRVSYPVDWERVRGGMMVSLVVGEQTA